MADTFDIMDFADCTPLVSDVEWDERLEALQASLKEKEKNGHNQKVVSTSDIDIAAHNLLAVGPNNDHVESADPKANTSEQSKHASLAALAKVCETESTQLANITAPSKGSEFDSDKLANLAVVAAASESESTVLDNSTALVEASEFELTHSANPPKRRRINQTDFRLPYGWVEIPIIRKRGKSTGRVDKVIIFFLI